jgi:alpha-L-rhamnosidase
MYQKLCGLQILEPGYKKSCITPQPIKGIAEAGAAVKTVYGILACKWSYNDKQFIAEITVPCNTSAVVRLPGKEEFTLGSGVYRYEYSIELDFKVPCISIPNW